MLKQALCRLCKQGGFGRPVGAEGVLKTPRKLAYRASAAPGVCNNALSILPMPFVQAEMGSGDVSGNTLERPRGQAKAPTYRGGGGRQQWRSPALPTPENSHGSPVFYLYSFSVVCCIQSGPMQALCARQFWEAAWSQAFKELLGGNRVLLSRGAGSLCSWALEISVNYP